MSLRFPANKIEAMFMCMTWKLQASSWSAAIDAYHPKYAWKLRSRAARLDRRARAFAKEHGLPG